MTGCVRRSIPWAVVVSDESDAYRGEMRWLAERLREMGHKAYEVHPRQIFFQEDGLYIEPGQDGPKTAGCASTCSTGSSSSST